MAGSKGKVKWEGPVFLRAGDGVPVNYEGRELEGSPEKGYTFRESEAEGADPERVRELEAENARLAGEAAAAEQARKELERQRADLEDQRAQLEAMRAQLSGGTTPPAQQPQGDKGKGGK